MSAMAKNLLNLKVFRIWAIFRFPEDPLRRQSFREGLFWVENDPLWTILMGVEFDPEFKAIFQPIYDPSPLASSTIVKIPSSIIF